MIFHSMGNIELKKLWKAILAIILIPLVVGFVIIEVSAGIVENKLRTFVDKLVNW